MAKSPIANVKDLSQLMRESAEMAYEPYEWVKYAFPWGQGELRNHSGPDVWQKDFLVNLGHRLEEIAVPITHGGVIREATASGKGPGKSSLVAWLLLFCMSTFEGTRGIVTANTEAQLKTKTWAELSKWHRLCITNPFLELAAERLYWNQSKYSGDYRIDIAPWSLQNIDSFQGLHNRDKRLLVVFDEAAGIPDEIWDATEGALTDEDTEIIWCVFGNPTRNTGRFRECFDGGLYAHRWNHRQIDTRTCRFSNKKQIEEWRQDRGEDSDFFKWSVRGEFPSAGENQFINSDDAKAAMTRDIRTEFFNFAPKIISVDPAWTGTDTFVIGLRQGLHFRVLETKERNDNHIEMAKRIAFYEDNEKADAVFIDVGQGTGIWSWGKDQGRNWQLVDFGSSSPDPGCKNMRAYIWTKMRDWLKEGGSYNCKPPNEQLYKELIAPELVPTLDGKTQLESKESMKKRGLKSPDLADCLAISFAYPVIKKKHETHSEYFIELDDQGFFVQAKKAQSYQTERQTFDDIRWRR